MLESWQQRVFSSEINDYFTGGFAQPTSTDDRDEHGDRLAQAGHPEDVQCTDPVAYWRAKVNGTQYPRLARMALDLMTAPPMSSEPERIFSLTGLLLTPNRAQLQFDIIGASIAVGSWDKEGIIVDLNWTYLLHLTTVSASVYSAPLVVLLE